MYYLLIQGGVIFEGSLKEFRKKNSDYPEFWSDESVLFHAKDWAEDNSWTFEFKLLN